MLAVWVLSIANYLNRLKVVIFYLYVSPQRLLNYLEILVQLTLLYCTLRKYNVW